MNTTLIFAGMFDVPEAYTSRANVRYIKPQGQHLDVVDVPLISEAAVVSPESQIIVVYQESMLVTLVSILGYNLYGLNYKTTIMVPVPSACPSIPSEISERIKCSLEEIESLDRGSYIVASSHEICRWDSLPKFTFVRNHIQITCRECYAQKVYFCGNSFWCTACTNSNPLKLTRARVLMP